jgi:hypothetical protein
MIRVLIVTYFEDAVAAALKDQRGVYNVKLNFDTTLM